MTGDGRFPIGRTLLNDVDAAVVEAGEAEEYATPDSALRWSLELAWSALDWARRYAANGRWSVDCGNQVTHIIGLTRLVGPLPWEKVPVDLVLDGVYEYIHAAVGTPTPLTEDDLRKVREIKAGVEG